MFSSILTAVMDGELAPKNYGELAPKIYGELAPKIYRELGG